MIAATGVSIAILVVFTVSSVFAGRGLTSPTGPGAITVDVIGHQWWWEFQYRDVTPSDFVTSPNELHIPVGVPVHIKAMSRDVIHSFWVPNLHGKRDLIPGQVTQHVDPGRYSRNLSRTVRGILRSPARHMAFVVVAEPMDRFLSWIGQQRQPAAIAAERRGPDAAATSFCSRHACVPPSERHNCRRAIGP